MCVGCQANPRHRPPRAVAELTSLGPHDRHPHHEQAQRPYKVGPGASLKAKGTPSPLKEREGRERVHHGCVKQVGWYQTSGAGAGGWLRSPEGVGWVGGRISNTLLLSG